MAVLAAQQWDPAKSVTATGTKAVTTNSTIFEAVHSTYSGNIQGGRIQTPWVPAWALTYFPPQSAALPGQTFLQMTGSDFISKANLLDKTEECEKSIMNTVGPTITASMTKDQLQKVSRYTDLLRSNVSRLGGDDAPPFMRASISPACCVYEATDVDADLSDSRNVKPVDSLCNRACAPPEQKTMDSGGKFYIYERSDPSVYLSAIINMDTFSWKFKPKNNAPPHAVLNPKVEQILLAPVTDSYVQSAGSYVESVKQSMSFGFFTLRADEEELDKIPAEAQENEDVSS